jgi:hypothetical protein
MAELNGVTNLEQAAELIDTRGYVCPTRPFAEQVEDETRTKMFRYKRNRYMTEIAGLRQLHDFLKSSEDSLGQAMLDSLTFIGEKEYAEGAAGLAAYWKRYLDSDPGVQLCALTGISSAFETTKSDLYLLKRILDHFSNQELRQYRGRLVFDTKYLTAPPDKARIALVDDWTISGSQMGIAYSCVISKDGMESYKDCIEINLLVASLKRLKSGLQPCGLPVKAYFVANKALGRVQALNDTYTSGAHSAVDYDFRDSLSSIAGSSWMIKIPALASVKSDYGRTPQLVSHAKRIAQRFVRKRKV